MNITIIKLFLISSFIFTLLACKPVTLSFKAPPQQTICLSKNKPADGFFYATGSSTTLEEAKQNARQDLVVQIYSDVSSSLENTVTDTNGQLDRLSSSWSKSESASIPVDRYKVTDSCKYGETYYVALVLKKAYLINSINLRLNNLLKESRKIISSKQKASLYLKYISRQKLQKILLTVSTYVQILNQYQQKTLDQKMTQQITELEKFITDSGRLVLGVKTDKLLRPLQADLEQALNTARLEYKQGTANTVATVELKASQIKNKLSGRYIVNLKASLNVNRSDTEKLLSRYELGHVIETSVLSYKIALQNAQDALSVRLKKHLRGSNAEIRKILGLEIYEK